MEWDYSGRKGRDGQKKKISIAKERKGKVKKKNEKVNGRGEKEGCSGPTRGMPVLLKLPMVLNAMPQCSATYYMNVWFYSLTNEYKKWGPYNYAKADEVDGENSSHISTAKYRKNRDNINHPAMYTHTHKSVIHSFMYINNISIIVLHLEDSKWMSRTYIAANPRNIW